MAQPGLHRQITVEVVQPGRLELPDGRSDAGVEPIPNGDRGPDLVADRSDLELVDEPSEIAQRHAKSYSRSYVRASVRQ